MKKFDPLKPFANPNAYQDFLSLFRDFKYKLYGKVKFEIVSKDDLEFDLYGGEMHYTEQDLVTLSKQLATLNKKWKIKITFCLFPSRKRPNIFINVRSPNALFALIA